MTTRRSQPEGLGTATGVQALKDRFAIGLLSPPSIRIVERTRRHALRDELCPLQAHDGESSNARN